jgi:lysine-N-methylase
MRPPFPSRPRLAAHVLGRRHLVDGDERVVLHDLGTGRLVQIGPREWGLLAAADGTRDLDGIVLAAAREGAHARGPALRAFLEQLHAAGLLEDGIEEASPDDAPGVPAARPLEPLPGFSLHCDGGGSCCRIYASVIFAPVEAARARALLPLVQDGGARHERVFMPEHGSGPTGGSAVTLRDGRCAYLDDGGLCALHARGGAGAKPVGCNAFPTSFIDDGESVRVSVSVECACVLASVGRPGGAPLLPPGAATRGDLDGAIVVDRLAEQVAVAPGSRASRAAFVAWSRRVAALPPSGDTAALLLRLAGAIDAGGLDEDAASRAAARPDRPAARALLPWIEALAARAERRSREDDAWRSERDLGRRATRWIARAAADLLQPGALEVVLAAPVAAPASEAFYLRAVLHGHRLAGDLPLSLALRDRAARLVVARALPLAFADGERDPACAHPLGLVEAMLRGHGLDAYAHDL